MKLGQNIGEILLDIAQNAIQNGNPKKAISTYTDYLNGFTEEYVIKLLKNEYVLITSKDEVSVDLTNGENERIANRDNITDWNIWVKNRLSSMMRTVKMLVGIQNEFEKFIDKYVDNIRILHKEYMEFISSYSFLLKHKFAVRPPFVEMYIESILNKLTEFADTSKGYYHPLCNTKLYEYKVRIVDDILSTEYGKEYRRYGIIEKNIIDGYDAGWLSPDGKFYGENGPASCMIHLRIAEKLNGGDLDGDRKLDEKGWIKIHGNEVYGTFIGDMIPKKDFPYQYCPTDKQIKMICDYIDKFHNGKMYTQPQIVKSTEYISTYKLRQMNEIMLHETFGL